MTDLTPEKRAEMRRGAEDATQGEWQPSCVAGAWCVSIRKIPIALDSTEPDARHIANCDPQTILGLLSKVAELEAEVERLRALIESGDCCGPCVVCRVREENGGD